MRIHNLIVAIALVLTGIAFNGCYYDTEEELYGNTTICDTTNVTYSATIKPIIDAHCITCHSGSSPSAGIDLTGYAEVQKQAITTNKLYGCMAQLSGFKKMPPSYKVSDCEILKVDNWVGKGAPQN